MPSKEFHRQKSKEHYERHKESYRERNRLQRARTRSIINEAKANGCEVCGEKETACLDFHHTGEKDKTVSQMLGMSDKRVRDEIAKCVILCANCHRKHHAGVLDL